MNEPKSRNIGTRMPRPGRGTTALVMTRQTYRRKPYASGRVLRVDRGRLKSTRIKGWFPAVRHRRRTALGYPVELGLATLLGASAANHVIGTARARPAAAAQQ